MRTHKRRGAIFVTTMWVVIALTGLVLVFARAMQVEATASANRQSQMQADAAERGAEQFVQAEVEAEVATPGSTVNVQFSQRQIGDAWFWVINPNPSDEQTRTYGLTDEGGKIDLNTATLTMLQALPNIDAATGSSIYNWRGVATAPDGQGAMDADYQDYLMKHQPFETTEELMLVKGVDLNLLFGSDTNHNGNIDQQEMQSGGLSVGIASTNSSARGIFPFVTAYGVRATAPSATATASSGSTTQRLVDINSASRQQLTNLFTNAALSQGPSIINQMIPAGGTPGRPTTRTRYANVFDFAVRVNLTSTDFSKIFTKITANAVGAGGGGGGGGGGGVVQRIARVNVNTAAKQTLMCLPNIQESDAESIISHVQQNASADPTDISWMLDVVNKSTLQLIGGLITGKSTCYSGDILAVSGDGRAFKRVRIVVDASKTPSVIIYRRDLTGSGWPLDTDVRTSLRAGKGPGQTSTLAFGKGTQ